jgi:hypothetical protein
MGIIKDRHGTYYVRRRVPERFGVSLSPSHNQPGRIEHLIRQEVSADPAFLCLVPAFKCVERLTNIPVDEKAQVQMFISAKANSNSPGFTAPFGPTSSTRQHKPTQFTGR